MESDSESWEVLSDTSGVTDSSWVQLGTLSRQATPARSWAEVAGAGALCPAPTPCSSPTAHDYAFAGTETGIAAKVKATCPNNDNTDANDFDNTDNDCDNEASADQVNAKPLAQGRTWRKFNEESLKRGSGSGATFWDRGDTGRPRLTIAKSGRSKGLETIFEQEIGLCFGAEGRATVSLDKARLWETVPAFLAQKADLEVEAALQGRRNDRLARESETQFALFGIDGESQSKAKRAKADKEIDDHLYNSIIKDARWQRGEAIRRRKREDILYRRLNTQAAIHTACAEIPLTVDCARIRIQKLTTRGKVVANTKVNAAHVEKPGHKSVWCCPGDDTRDFLEVDLGKVCHVRFVGTKGRALERKIDKNGLFSVVKGSPEQWVTRYRLFYKKESGQVWLPLGELEGNRDSESEKVHPLVDERTEKKGIEARFFRVQPSAFHGRKAMRVGFYGTTPCEQEEDDRRAANRKNHRGADGKSALQLKDADVCFTLSRTESARHVGKRNFSLSSCSCAMCRGDLAKQRLVARRSVKTRARQELDFYLAARASGEFGRDCPWWPEVTCSQRYIRIF